MNAHAACSVVSAGVTPNGETSGTGAPNTYISGIVPSTSGPYLTIYWTTISSGVQSSATLVYGPVSGPVGSATGGWGGPGNTFPMTRLSVSSDGRVWTINGGSTITFTDVWSSPGASIGIAPGAYAGYYTGISSSGTGYQFHRATRMTSTGPWSRGSDGMSINSNCLVGVSAAGNWGNVTLSAVTYPGVTNLQFTIDGVVVASTTGAPYVYNTQRIPNGKHSYSVTATFPWGVGTSATQYFITDNVVLTAGRYHTCHITIAGALHCYGRNAYGELGAPIATTYSAVPYAVPTMGTGVTSAAAGYDHTCGVKSGSLYCWGRNTYGQLGPTSVASTSTPTLVTGLPTTVNKVVAGKSFTCALLTDGKVYCWGLNGDKQLGINSAIASTGTPQYVSTLGTGNASVVTSSEAGHVCVVRAGGFTTGGGQLRCWGKNDYGQVGNGTTTTVGLPALVRSDITSVGVGTRHSCAVTNATGMMCWGSNESGILGTGTMTPSSTPVNVVGLAGPVQAAIPSSVMSCAIYENRALDCWGSNSSGHLGNGTWTDSWSPVPIMASNVVAVANGGAGSDIGAGHTCAYAPIGATEKFYCWGYGGYGQCGHGGLSTPLVPTVVSGF